jgi:small subunit ribosomal protein S1
MTGPLAARGLGIVRPLSPQSPADVVVGEPFPPDRKRLRENGKKNKAQPRHRLAGETQGSSGADESDSTTTTAAQAGEGVTATPRGGKPKVAVPNRRQGLPADIQAELDAELAAADVTSILSGSAGMPDRREPLGEGSRVQAKILKIHEDSVFVSLGGPDEGVVPFEQFTGAEPTIGQMVEVLVRGFNRDDGLYVLTIPGQAIDVSDWSDIEEGAVVEATITAANTGGVECTVGGARGFIPISQLSEHRVEDATEFIGRKLMCVVTEANQRRGNLVLSHRATLEREREDRKREQLEKFEAGLELEGTVRSIKDFGAFIDLGGLDGMVHISKLSWERIKHPSEVLEAGQKVRVVIEKIDKQSGKISLSYRDLLVNPWDTAEATFQPGTVHQGEITRTANFGAFVRLAPGVEGLVHISELAHHRVSKVDSIVSVGQNVEVKVLSFDRNTQKISLSMKATLAKPEVEGEKPAPEEVDEPVREMAVKQHVGPLKGGNNRDTGGERFGLRW